jgi:hypothetical protein
MSGVQSTATITLTVVSVDDPPVISNIPNQTIEENTSTEGISITIGDNDHPLSALEVSAASSNTDIVPLSNIILTEGENGELAVTVIPANYQSTWDETLAMHVPVVITLTVSDGELTTSISFELTIEPTTKYLYLPLVIGKAPTYVLYLPLAYQNDEEIWPPYSFPLENHRR